MNLANEPNQLSRDSPLAWPEAITSTSFTSLLYLALAAVPSGLRPARSLLFCSYALGGSSVVVAVGLSSAALWALICRSARSTAATAGAVWLSYIALLLPTTQLLGVHSNVLVGGA